MSRGFPSRPTRSEFGPRPVNRRPVRSPQNELDAGIGEMMLSQISGTSLLAALAELDVTIQSGSPTVTINRRKEAWNQDGSTTGDFADPTVLRTGTGVMTIEYLAQIQDTFGNLQDVVFYGGFASIVSAHGNVSQCEVFPTVPPSSKVEVRARHFTAGNFAAVDGKINVRLW